MARLAIFGVSLVVIFLAWAAYATGVTAFLFGSAVVALPAAAALLWADHRPSHRRLP